MLPCINSVNLQNAIDLSGLINDLAKSYLALDGKKRLRTSKLFPSNAIWLSPGRLSIRKASCILQIHPISAAIENLKTYSNSSRKQNLKKPQKTSNASGLRGNIANHFSLCWNFNSMVSSVVGDLVTQWYNARLRTVHRQLAADRFPPGTGP